MESTTRPHNSAVKYALVVENDEGAAQALEEVVRAEGFDIRTTWSGREALALVQSQAFDLVLVDSHLPDIYYGEFLKLARRHVSCIIVMQKSKPLPGSLRRHKSMGAAAVVAKSDFKHLRQLLAARHGRSAPA